MSLQPKKLGSSSFFLIISAVMICVPSRDLSLSTYVWVLAHTGEERQQEKSERCVKKHCRKLTTRRILVHTYEHLLSRSARLSWLVQSCLSGPKNSNLTARFIFENL